MEAEQRGHFVFILDIVVADGALSILAAIFRFQKTGPVLFDIFVVLALGV